MKKISLTLKITIAFILVSMTTLTFIYFVFYNLFEERMLKSEKEKAVLIAQTIEPMIGMSYYLGLRDEIELVSKHTVENKNITSLRIVINEEDIFYSPSKQEKEHLDISYSIKDPITRLNIGDITLGFKLENFNNAFEEIKSKIMNYLFLLSFVFIIFAFITRYLLSPLAKIASKVKSYHPGSRLDFSSIRVERETSAITDAFKKMLGNMRKHTTLLERYKYALDESAIVSKTDPIGVITYANDEFCRISCYTREELIGSPHNIVRHPDMSTAVFADLWKTLHEKKVWKGVVKNRKKDGTAYYAKAVIVPIYNENGETVEYISIRHDITQIVKQQEQITRQVTERVTGLPNRVKLEEDIKSFKTPKFALINLNNFHIIKEYFGYDIGNHTLKETAKMLKKHVDGNEIKLYKLSLGEFGVLAGDNVDSTEFQNVCSSILQRIDDFTVHSNDDSFNINATAGITYSKVNTITNASLALRQAKDMRKELLVYEETDNLIKYYENNIQWTKRLKSAFAEDRIVVYVQAIVDAKTLQTDKYECLVRMIGEDGSIISPFHFLDIAKKSKLYHTLTKKVISSAFDVFSKIPDTIFSINFSLEDLIHTETMDFLKDKIREYDIASRFVMEIVESEGIDGYSEIVSLMAELKSLGCRVSIDDFGTGYSNFAYLMQLNVDYIKIDGSLIKEIDHDINSQIISKTILDFAKQLGLKTVAEFIHNESVMRYTQEMGIDYLQGFHLGEPMPIENLISQKILLN